MPGFARVDLDEARKHVAAGKADANAPAWEPIIDAFVANDRERLSIKDGLHARLAALLRLMLVEYPSHSALALAAAGDAISAEPDCFRAYDALCRVGGVSNLHGATTAGPEALARVFPTKLAAADAIPVGVREAIGREGDTRGLADALERASTPAADRGEPSWCVLAHLVRETLFVQTYRRLDFLKEWLSVPVDDFWTNAGPVVVGHRFRPFLQSLALPSKEADRILADFAGRLDRTDIEFSAAPVFHTLMRLKPPLGVEPWQFAWMHNDATVHDYSLAIENSDPKTHPVLARTLLAINPRSDLAMATLIDHDWDGVKNKVPAWEKEVGEAPALLGISGSITARPSSTTSRGRSSLVSSSNPPRAGPTR